MKTQITKKEWKEQYSAARMLSHAWAYRNTDVNVRMEGARKVVHNTCNKAILNMHPSIINAIRYGHDASMRGYYMECGVDRFYIRQRLKYPR